MLCCVLIAFLAWPLGITAESIRSARNAAHAAGRAFLRPRPLPLVAWSGVILTAALLISINPYWMRVGARSAGIAFHHFCVFAAAANNP